MRAQYYPMRMAGMKRRPAPRRKGNPFMKFRVAGYSELKMPEAVSMAKLFTQATAEKRAPVKKEMPHSGV